MLVLLAGGVGMGGGSASPPPAGGAKDIIQTGGTSHTGASTTSIVRV